MKKNLIKVLAIILIISCIIVISMLDINENQDTIKYKGKTYVLLEYNMDIFTYNYNNDSSEFYEEDIIHPCKHDKWDVVYFNGDLFILDNQVKKATRYYQSDKNYNWYIIFNKEDEDIKKTLPINVQELSYLYDIENKRRDTTIIFDDIEMFADILKISKDGLVQGITTLVYVGGNWYYKTEIMMNDDREYVIKLNDSLNNKINNLMD